ncbi:MAG: hypothetical protein QOI82_551 [Actinomycetota bacterium]|jgi:hypothetical protein|nr:hypothetical protein [Actinomycetota bacterium]
MTTSAGRPDGQALLGSSGDVTLGKWSARAIAALSLPYALTMALGFSSMGNLRDPLPDPYLAVAELLILLMAPFMVTLMIAVHACAPTRFRALSLAALGWMFLLAGVTMTVHFVELTFVRRINPADVPGFDRLLDFQWPSLLYAADIAAWDLFLGLALLCAAPAFSGARHRWARRGLLVSGALCLLGLVGPVFNVLAWRGIGIFGYAVVFPVTCLALSRAFASTQRASAPLSPGLGPTRPGSRSAAGVDVEKRHVLLTAEAHSRTATTADAGRS